MIFLGHRLSRFAGAALLAAGLTLPMASEAAPELDFPVRCEVGTDCWIVQYFDHDPSPKARDYACGFRSYDGHDGTDIGLASLSDMQKGFSVVAAADGRVFNIRDGVPDEYYDPKTSRLDRQQGCGNGVVVQHAEGWRTYYCHLRRGSVRVAKGDVVRRGQELGLVGMSGIAQFPHLEFGVLQGREKIDPFVGTDKAAVNSCQRSGSSLWSARASAETAYQRTDIYASGFSERPVKLEDISQGKAQPLPTRRSRAMIAWFVSWAVREGDVLNIELQGPDGSNVALHSHTMTRNRIRQMLFAGGRHPTGGWLPGRYTARFTVTDSKGRSVERARRVLELR